MELSEWSILKPLKPYFLKTVRSALVFGASGNEALLITHDDRVYGIGTNKVGLLGLGDDTARTTPTEILSLSCKGVKGFAFGGGLISGEGSENRFVIAYLDKGQLYQWGFIPWTETTLLEPLLVHKLENKVIEVACGSSHCVALCENGQVYTWGANKKGQLGREVKELESGSNNDESPKNCEIDRVRGILEEKFVIQVSCGAEFTVVLLSNGRAVSWGSNECRQLGIDDSSSFVGTPTEIGSNLGSIHKVACGRAHVVALNHENKIISWGNNTPFGIVISSLVSFGLFSSPVFHSSYDGSSDIGALYLFDFIVVIDRNRKSIILGDVPDGGVKSESYHSVHKSFLGCAFTMHKHFYPLKSPRTLLEIVGNAFENRESCDLIIEVEEKEFHVHKTILMLRSEFFRTIFARWMDANQKVLLLKENSHKVIEAYLKYIYSDTVEADIDLDLAIDLLLMADEYGENDVKFICERIIKDRITVEKVADLYPLIYKMKNVESLNAHCIDLAYREPDHFEIMVHSHGYKSWDSDTLQTFVPQYAKRRRLN